MIFYDIVQIEQKNQTLAQLDSDSKVSQHSVRLSVTQDEMTQLKSSLFFCWNPIAH